MSDEQLPITDPPGPERDVEPTEPAGDAPPPIDPARADASTEPLLDALRQVVDPELFVNIVDLGLIYAVNRVERTVAVDMTLTSPACPAGPQLIHQSKQALERLDDVDEATINLVMSPPWSPERMTDDARDQLGIF